MEELMTPIEFPQMTGTAAKDQPEYLPLPMYRDDEYVISCWRMSILDRIKVLLRGRVWLWLMIPPGKSITPSIVAADDPFLNSTEREDDNT